MLYFLQTADELKKIIPTVNGVKTAIKINEGRFSAYLDSFITSIIEFTPKVVSALLVLIIGMWLVKRISIIAEKAMKRRDLEVSLRTFLKSLVSIGLKIILIVTVAGMMGIGTASFVTILGAAGLAVGLALQGSLSNFAGGVLILIFKPFKVTDVIEAQGQSGEVKEIQIFNTLLLTADNKTVILPNGPLSNGTIVNITRYGSLRIDIALSIGNTNDINYVKEIIITVLNQNEKVLKEFEPGIFIGKSHDGAININIKPYCLPSFASILSSELYHDLIEAFNKYNIKPPLPQRKVLSAKDEFAD